METNKIELARLYDLKNSLKLQVQQIEEQISNLIATNQTKNRPRRGRKKGSKSSSSLDSIIINALQDNQNGLSFSNLMSHILFKGYTTKTTPEKFKKILHTRLSQLKSQNKIKKDEVNLLFKFI